MLWGVGLAFGVLGLLYVKGGWRAPASLSILQGVLGCPAGPRALIEACTNDVIIQHLTAQKGPFAAASAAQELCLSLSSNQRLHRCPHASVSLHPGDLCPLLFRCRQLGECGMAWLLESEVSLWASAETHISLLK